MPLEFLQVGSRITVLPIIHGSGDFAVEVRRVMLSREFDCLAVPLPRSFQADVERAIEYLPEITAVVQEAPRRFVVKEWTPQADLEDDFADDPDDQREVSYVPVDPCQGVIAALRIAVGEHIPRAFIDLETERFEPLAGVLPDPYALKKVPADRFAAAVLPTIPRPPQGQFRDRIVTMAARLRELEAQFRSILFVCSLIEWPWVREAFMATGRWGTAPKARSAAGRSQDLENAPVTGSDPEADASGSPLPEDDLVEDTEIHAVDPQTLVFFTGELPFITGLYERARAELDDDENLSIDGVKEMLLAARDRYASRQPGGLQKRGRESFSGESDNHSTIPHGKRPPTPFPALSIITPKLLSIYFQYVRNLALIERRMTPDLYTLIVAAQQVFGDQFAVALAETAREYSSVGTAHRDNALGTGDGGQSPPGDLPVLQMGIGRAQLFDGDVVGMVSRLPGHPVRWRSCRLNPLPPRLKQTEWKLRWDPFRQCSYPPEDVAIEKFRTHVKDAALAIMGADLARTEKFTTSLKDGLDIRETLRNWHTGDLYVKIFPPTRGNLDCVVMLFDSPADPRDYPWRITWHAEHQDESTLALFATDFRQEIVGPGIALATYGGAMFLFPPRHIPDVWSDPRFDFADTLEERLLAAACHYSEERHVALLSPAPPGAGWRRLAKKHGKKLVHIPLSRFSRQTVQQLRLFHVLNGRQVRSYAAHFIRRA